MRQRKRQTVALFPALILAVAVPANSDESDDHKARLGFIYKRGVNDNTRVFGDWKYEELRDRDYLWGESSKLSTSLGGAYDLTDRLRAEAALGIYYTWKQELEDTGEARLWQSLTLDWPEVHGPRRRFMLQHRVRLEERFQEQDNWDMTLRARYRLSYSWPLNRYTVEPGAYYVPMAAEFYVDIDDTNELFADQAEYTAGIGYVLNKTWSLELRYTRQEKQVSAGSGFDNTDHVIDFQVKTAVLIRDLLKAR